MRCFLLAAFPAMIWALGGAPVEGVVINSVAHTALSGVSVLLICTSAQGRVTYSATTITDGSFRIGSIDQDGECQANFQKRGFRDLPPRPFHLAAASGPVRLDVELSPNSQLRGRVLDAGGHPVAEAHLQLLGTGGNWILNTPLDKDGVFVYQDRLPSAAFVMRAVPDPKLPPPKSTGEGPLVWAPTYYPDGTDPSQAARIVWHGDTDLDGYDIRLRAVPAFHVRGVVVDETGKPVAGAAVKLVAAGAVDGTTQLASEAAEAQTATQGEGVFDISAVRPGDWRLAAEWKRGEQSLSGFATGRVSRSDWEDVRIKLEVPFTVKGVAELLGGDTQRRAASGAVALVPANGSTGLLPGGRVAPYREDGHFEIRDVLPGKYRIVSPGARAGAYLDSVQFGGREVLGQTVDLADGSLSIRLVFKTNGGRVQGSVEHCVAVVAFPKDPSTRDSQSLRTRTCDSSGRFDIGGLRPGDYYVMALAAPELESLAQALDELTFDPGFVAPLAPNAESVRVEGGQSTTVTLKLTAWPVQ